MAGAFAALAAFVVATTVLLPAATGIDGPLSEFPYAVGLAAFTGLSSPYALLPTGALSPALRAPLFAASVLANAWATAAALAALRRRVVRRGR